MTGAHSLVSTPRRRRSVLLKQRLVRVSFLSLISRTYCLRSTELQGQNAGAVVGEMRDALIDNWA